MRNQGFTLIEMLVVIALIGILALALLPNLSRARYMASSRAAAAHGADVYTTLNGFMSTRAGTTADAILNTLPAATDSVGGVPSGGKDCTNGYALNSALTNATPVTDPPANTPAWGHAPQDAACVIVPFGSVNEYAVKVYSWSKRMPDKIYINGKAQ